MAGTYANMQTRIADDLLNSAVSAAQIQNAILTSIAYYDSERLYFNQKTATFNTVAAQEYYGASDLADIPNIVSLDNALLTVNGYKRKLVTVDFGIMDDEQNGYVNGPPYWLAYYGQQIRLYPNPDAVYTTTLSYQYKFAALSAGTDTNAWMVDGEELIRQSAKKRIALDILFDDAMAARCASLEDQALTSLQQETRRKLPNKQLAIPAMVQGRRFNIFQG